MVEAVPCPICSRGLPSDKLRAAESKISVECSRCGRFVITDDVVPKLSQLDTPWILSAWVRAHQQEDDNGTLIDTRRLDEILKNTPSYSPTEKQTLWIRKFATRSQYPGDDAPVDYVDDYPCAWAQNEEELRYLTESLVGRELLSDRNPGANVPDLVITPKGWDYLDEHAQKAALSHQAFVAMWFDRAMDSAWEAMREAITDAGFEPIRVDQVEHNERIDAKIISDIRDSRFLVADVTGQRQGVYFEAGFALGLGRPVIWSVRSDELNKAHFDTRQYNHIVWNSEQDLREKLYYRIRATIS